MMMLRTLFRCLLGDGMSKGTRFLCVYIYVHMLKVVERKRGINGGLHQLLPNGVRF